MKKRLVQAFLGCAVLLTACGSAGNAVKETSGEITKETTAVYAEKETAGQKETGTAVTFTDDLGRQVTVDRPERVVCMISSFADIWTLAGGVDQIVATTSATWRYFDLPMKEDVVDLGGTKEINVEQLIACEPDFILASSGTDRNVELEKTFDAMGMNVAYFNVDNFDDYLDMLKICTDITGYPEHYETYGVQVQEKVEQMLLRPDGSKPTVLYIRATGSSCKVKNSKDSVLGEMLEKLDCVNIADQEDALLEQLSMEAILQADPDHIFVVMQSADPADAEAMLEKTLFSNPAWATLTAVKEGRYHVMEQNLYNLKPNGRWGEAYEKLADILYPEQ